MKAMCKSRIRKGKNKHLEENMMCVSIFLKIPVLKEKCINCL